MEKTGDKTSDKPNDKPSDRASEKNGEKAVGPMVELKDVNHVYRLDSGQKIRVLRDINLSIVEDEIVVILGPSGTGKSTLLRILSGIIEPTFGKVMIQGQELMGMNPMCSMVFQSFVLLPWLTVYENVALAIEPLRLSDEQQKDRVKHAIDLVGLEGFEEAYPKELSGGMKQRVGIARALAMQRPVLCLDEAFSALDVLTAETLRREVLRLWISRQLGARSMVIVTHNISEAASLGKRIFILGNNPGHIRVVIKNDLPYPRDERSAGFKSLVDNIHDVITESVIPDTPEWVPPSLANSSSVESLPPVAMNEVVGLMEVVSSQGGRADSFQLSHTLQKEFGNILFLAKAAEILDFVDTPRNFIVLTDLGRQYVNGDPNRRKRIVHEAMRRLRICQLVEEQLRTSENLTLSKSAILQTIHEWLP